MLVTLDTNILYQALMSTSGASNFIIQKIRTRKIQVALSVPVYCEYQDVLSRKQSLENFGLELNDINKFLRFIAYIGKPYDIHYLLRPNLKDEQDNMIFELAVTSQSEYLITSNVRDFVIAELHFEDFKIITPGKFVKLWRENDG